MADCQDGGIVLGPNGLAFRNVIFNNSGSRAGLEGPATMGYADNQITGNATDVSGGRPMGVNVCSGGIPCSRFPPARRYYLAAGPISGDQARTSCAEGFHMATLWEILEPWSLEYDADLGENISHLESGPPDILPGWVQGLAPSCNLWTEGTDATSGSTLRLNATPVDTTPGSTFQFWSKDEAGCSGASGFSGIRVGVWCVED